MLLQRTDSAAWAVALVPFGGPIPALWTVIWRSSTGAELPAASSTLTARWWAPLATFVVSRATWTLSDWGQGLTYRNAGSPSLVSPTFRQRPPFSLGTVVCTTWPSTEKTTS